jgi:2-C-methyl-D-erythritol 2,4-cyclodiphosphate synthase
MDALLGAAALGDIGNQFPNTDEKWKNADSIDMLKTVYSLVKSKGYVLGNADITIVAEQPRLSPYIERMRSVIADAIGVDIMDISVKATTEEKLGFTGDGTGISSSAVVLLDKM